MGISASVLGVSSGPELEFLQRDGSIRDRVNLEFIVLDWDSDAFLAEYTPTFIYYGRNIILLTS